MFWFFIIPIAVLIIGLFDLPIGYYTFLRIIVCICGFLIAYVFYLQKRVVNGGAVLFSLIAIFFNPIIPIYLNRKSVWTTIDLITAIIFAIAFFYFKQKN